MTIYLSTRISLIKIPKVGTTTPPLRFFPLPAVHPEPPFFVSFETPLSLVYLSLRPCCALASRLGKLHPERHGVRRHQLEIGYLPTRPARKKRRLRVDFKQPAPTRESRRSLSPPFAWHERRHGFPALDITNCRGEEEELPWGPIIKLENAASSVIGLVWGGRKSGQRSPMTRESRSRQHLP
jgi:hypothetical protein